MLIRDIPKIMIICLLSTIIIEIFFAFLFKVRKKKDFLNIILVNMITNPIVVITSMYIGLKCGLIYRNISLIILEISTVIIEGFIYYKYLNYRKINPYLLSFLLNLLSYFIGEVYWRLV